MIGGKTGHKGFQAREIAADVLVNALAKHYQDTQVIRNPEWADLVKTASLKQLAPANNNWWYIRAAAVTRQIYLHHDASLSGLAFHYGANMKAVTMPKHHHEASRKVIRTILQQLEKAGLVRVAEKGRQLTPKGQKLLDQIANGCGKKL
ncbi:ribosomal protein S19e, putative [Trichomonas vaginalis G3]|uniref:Ribosomal protein S19e, putative n=1 Tax=Trichomonas vaginalis (strain ATCC PRA-98 / G3) TaxID=412133 RepID=A2EN51_TRIV3|nr:ribosomal small subunit assembly [Trichomonas vaginalis G3]EAY05888.1 ribosomal protein S19e, putative [Trichomonas vaginalis G3]KAI5520228.1 ribosomal small subunit assembly [Trichomonas vaginalis G3]|eukprot:XP_001318111.1 ribosomal protein S19e [Trichomonas vaginalis G3]